MKKTMKKILILLLLVSAISGCSFSSNNDNDGEKIDVSDKYVTEEDKEYEIIAAFNSRVYYQDETDVFRYYYFVNAENETDYKNYINECKKASIYDTGKSATYGDQLLTLSTCDYSQKNGRFVVVAKEVKD